MIKINRAEFRDKLYGCWLGKNIGGTMGTPYEGSSEMNDISGYNSAPGAPLPNDDLDLQLLWLYLIEQYGPSNFSVQLLGDFWIDGVPPYWNEYGTCKTNLRMGLLPPISGEFRNDAWKHSNGAWIRSEVWAGLAPYFSDIANKYAVMDAMVDHGLGEGTYAEIFTASLESAAYYESDIKKLIDIALSKIPGDCRVAKAINLVKEEYAKGTDYRVVREMLVEQSKDIGWFQAPANLGFVTIGLLYGEGDFKKSLIYAINCGDDTDCTGATVGAILGIIGGTKSIPEDWQAYIGDAIIKCAINGQWFGSTPKSCTELTDRIMAQVPIMLRENGIEMEYTDEPTEIDEKTFADYNKLTADDFLDRKPYSFDITNDNTRWVRVEYDKAPTIAAGEEFKITLHVYNKVYTTSQSQVRIILPDGFSAKPYAKSLQLRHCLQQPKEGAIWEATIVAGESVDMINRIYVELINYGQCNAMMIPITLIG